jgi:hypothetical protein
MPASERIIHPYTKPTVDEIENAKIWAEKNGDNHPEYLHKLEEQWKKGRKVPSERELIIQHPELRPMTLEKIAEIEEETAEIRHKLKDFFEYVVETTSDDFTRWFWKYVATSMQEPLLSSGKKRLHILRSALSSGNNNRQQDDANLENARAFPILELAEQSTQMRRTGRSHLGRCPFHEEKTASFHVYPSQNRFHCYGCNRDGDSISFVMERDSVGFREAINTLVGGAR